MIPAITGNYDVPGGFVESMEIAPAGLPPCNEIPAEIAAKGLTGGYPFLKGDMMAHPYLVLEAIKTEKPYKIRGMFIQANNTLISMADAQHTYDCLRELDFLVYMDVFMIDGRAGGYCAAGCPMGGGRLSVLHAGICRPGAAVPAEVRAGGGM